MLGGTPYHPPPALSFQRQRQRTDFRLAFKQNHDCQYRQLPQRWRWFRFISSLVTAIGYIIIIDTHSVVSSSQQYFQDPDNCLYRYWKPYNFWSPLTRTSFSGIPTRLAPTLCIVTGKINVFMVMLLFAVLCLPHNKILLWLSRFLCSFVYPSDKRTSQPSVYSFIRTREIVTTTR